MKLNRTAAALLTCSLAVSACNTTQRVVEPLRPDQTNPERFVCERTGTRPTIPPEFQIDWTPIELAPNVPAAVALMREALAHFVAVIRTREGIVAGYIVTLEGANFTCFNNMAWQRDFYSRLPASQ